MIDTTYRTILSTDGTFHLASQASMPVTFALVRSSDWDDQPTVILLWTSAMHHGREPEVQEDLDCLFFKTEDKADGFLERMLGAASQSELTDTKKLIAFLREFGFTNLPLEKFVVDERATPSCDTCTTRLSEWVKAAEAVDGLDRMLPVDPDDNA